MRREGPFVVVFARAADDVIDQGDYVVLCNRCGWSKYYDTQAAADWDAFTHARNIRKRGDCS